ncbi:hypothetical protein VTN31DRAFT_4715 [Thermomyces dupontii]|uniref:uncharacterized protein n=1 Tax=Talaromyces thermophilus TaxID=28565 RepID=UPI003742194C
MVEPDGIVASSPERVRQHHHIDGRTLEGGGQLVRNALTLSSLTRKPITITHIRGKREGGKKGLKGSHVAAVRFLAEVCRAEVTGAEAGSETVEFIPEWGATPSCTSSTTTTPSRVDGGERATGDGATLTPIAVAAAAVQPEYVIELPTAGSVFLVFQALYPYLLRAGAGVWAREEEGREAAPAHHGRHKRAQGAVV